MSEARDVLYLLDVNNWIFRAFHAIRGLSNSAGTPTNAAYGFTQMLLKLLDEQKPTHVVAVLDGEGPGFREAQYAAYKANRPPLPPELAPQLEPIQQIVEALGVPRCGAATYEADDVIATLTRAAVREGWDVVILSSDKDLAQLVSPRVTLWDTMAEKRYGPDEVREKWGVPPERIGDLLALTGDTSDNVPGVRGIGAKGAAALIQELGSLGDIYARLDAVKGKKREWLEQSREDAFLSLDLVTLRDAPVSCELSTFRLGEPDADRLNALFRALEFRRLAERFPPTGRPRLAAAGGAAGGAAGEAPSGGAPAAIGRDATLVTDEAGLAALIAAIGAAPTVAFGLEATSASVAYAQVVALAFATAPGRAWYVPVAHRGLVELPPQLPLARVLSAVGPALARGDLRRVVHDHKRDVTLLAAAGAPVGPVHFDPLLASYVLDPGTNRHGLPELARHWLDHGTLSFEDLCGKGRDQVPFERLPVDRAAAYAGEKAQVALRLAEVLTAPVEEAGLGPLLRDVELPLAAVLGRMERRGLPVDGTRLEQLSRRFAERMLTLERQAHELAGAPFNLGSPRQLAEVLFDRLALASKRRTKTGRSTDSAVLEALADDHALPGVILAWRTVQKLRGTYADALRQLIHPRTGRIHTCLNQAVAATGRLSSADPNLQNIPVRTEEGREIRAAFVAPPGFRFLSADYSQIELRVLAHLSGDEALGQAFRDGADVHTRTAAELYGVPESAVTRDQRRSAKAINFGIVYGMGATRLARDIAVSRTAAQEVIGRYFRRYAGVKRYLDETVEQARATGQVRTLLGRRRLLPELASSEAQVRAFGERTAINTPVQGSAADLIKLAMLRVESALDAAGLRSVMVLQVHDELLFEVPEDELEPVAALVREAMEGVHPLRVPLRIDIHTGPDWSAAHD
jgi:DNA polymerase-1